MTTTTTGAALACRVSVVIKALNEEKRIAKAIETSLAALLNVGGEVILADSCSTDRTLEIACDYPITIVQLADPEERCCGIGPQLGYQHSNGEFVYILDGDMEMLPDFLATAVAFLDNHPQHAGVGGKVVEMNTESLEYAARMERATGHMQAGEVDRLDMGGLYRRAAIAQVGYFSNRNLHAYEEYDLAVRLRVAGWKLKRLDIESVRHYGHDAPPYQLLMRRWKSKYICGLGELLKAAAGKPHFGTILSEVKELRIYAATLFWSILILVMAFVPIPIQARSIMLTPIILFPIILMAFRKNSLKKGIFSVVSWCYNTAGLLRGLLCTAKDPNNPINSRLCKISKQSKISVNF